MWMKMALMAASRAEITEHAEEKPSVGCVIRRSRNKGPPAILSVGWNGFLPNTPEEEMEAIKGGSFKSNKQKDNILTAELGLHAEVNALQYCTENAELATVYTTHIPCYNCAKQLVAHKVGRVFYLFWMTGAETTIKLFKKFDITCIAFDKRDLVLQDFSQSFLEDHGIVKGSTDKETPPEQCPRFLDSRDAPKEGMSSLSGSDSEIN